MLPDFGADLEVSRFWPRPSRTAKYWLPSAPFVSERCSIAPHGAFRLFFSFFCPQRSNLFCGVAHRRNVTRRVRIPPDVARVLELYQQLGDAARRGLHLAEKQAEAELREAVRAAEALRKRTRRP